MATAVTVVAPAALGVGGALVGAYQVKWEIDDVRQSFAIGIAGELASRCDPVLLLKSSSLLLDHAAEQLAASLHGKPPPTLRPQPAAHSLPDGTVDHTAWPAFDRILWHDPNIGNDENQHYIQMLRCQYPDLQVFSSFNDAERYVRDNPLTSFTVLSSGSNGKDLMAKIHDCLNVERCYIFCATLEYHTPWAAGYKKVLDVVDDVEDVVNRLSEPPPNPRFVFYKLEHLEEQYNEVNRIWTHSKLFSCSESLTMGDAVRHLVELRREKHPTIISSEAEINKWSGWFSSPHAHYEDLLMLYTLEAVHIYDTLNAALLRKRRNRGLLMITKLAESFVLALRVALSNDSQLKWNKKVFRGLVVTDEELAEIKRSIDKFVCFRSFTSTSTSEIEAREFMGETGNKVLMEIDCSAVSSDIVCTPPILISKFSGFEDEMEVLLQPLACLKVAKVQERSDETIVQMTLVAGLPEMPAAFMYAFM